jgi:Pvc16 N-terminal domain
LATYRAIAATGLAILGFLENACPRSEFPNADFELYRANNFDAPMNTGISLYLYRVAVNASRRNLPPTTGPDGKRYRPPLPLDLFYMLTAWGTTAEVQQRLLGWAMRELEDTPILPSSLLNHYVKEIDTFRPSETVEILCEAISLQDMNALWEGFKAAKTNQQLSVTYVARMLLVESKVEMAVYPPAQTRVFDYEKAPAQ